MNLDNVRTTVVIVGAGPTGLLLAGDLAAAGIDVTVLERRTTGSNLTRAFGVHARTLELLDARGLAEQVVATGTPVAQLRLFDRIHVDLSRLPSRFPYLLITPQYHVEHALEARAVAAGARIRYGAEVVGLRQDAEQVHLDVRTDAGTHAVHARYAVGADGVRSAVREAIGQPFPGRSVLTSIMLADVRLTESPGDALAVNAVGDGFAFVAPFGDGWFRIFAWDRRNPLPDTAPVTLDEIREVTRRALGTDFGMHDPRWMSRFHSDERQVPRYRVGRVFLAGDAAHVHSPAGGQGMNTGLQDAANLSWKLIATIHGWAADDLLDTYQTERHPVGATVLRSSGAIIRLAMIRSHIGRLARNLVGSAAMRLGPVARTAAGTISGIGIDYPGAPRTPDIELRDGHRLNELLRAGTFVLLAPERTAHTACGWQNRLTVAEPAAGDTTLTLVRPDGYTAWTGDESRLQEALRRNLGSPAAALTP
jgi:2-polyprenyl-6-methoxyphenol hydroxylase-like FAD-dependent oxidoreductase